MQPSVALFLVLSLLLMQSKELTQAEPHKSTEQHLETSVSLSDADMMLCSMLLILQVLLMLTRKGGLRHTANQTMVLSTTLSNVTQKLVRTGAQHLLSAQPPGINPDLVKGVLQQLKVVLRQATKCSPSLADTALDVLLRMRSLAPLKHGIADEFTKQGEREAPRLFCAAADELHLQLFGKMHNSCTGVQHTYD